MKKVLTYALLVGFFSALTLYVCEKGNLMFTHSAEIVAGQNVSLGSNAKPVVIDGNANVVNQFFTNIKYPLSILLLQVIIILFASRIFGKIGRAHV